MQASITVYRLAAKVRDRRNGNADAAILDQSVDPGN